MKVMCGMLILYCIQNVIFSLQNPAAVVQFSPKAKSKEPAVGIWKYMTVADVANAIGKSVGKSFSLWNKGLFHVRSCSKWNLEKHSQSCLLLWPVSCACHGRALLSLPLVYGTCRILSDIFHNIILLY
jgi:hypothetical protein